MTAQERYTQANAAHMAVAAAIGASHPRPRKGSDLDRQFNETHEARRLAFLAVVAEMRRA